MGGRPARHEAMQPAAGNGELVLDQFLPYRLSVLSNRISNAIAREYSRRFALSVTEWRVMAVLGHAPDLSAGEVARRTAMDKVAVSRAVASLIASGRLLRRLDAGDRRRSLLRLSKAGDAIHGQIAPLALGFERQILGALNSDERERLFRLLDRLDELELQAEAGIAAGRTATQ